MRASDKSERTGDRITPCYYTSADQSTVYTNAIVDVPTNGVDWSANGCRLPTEAEWEKAARGGRQGRLFPWGGDTIQHAQANYNSDTNYSYDISPTKGFHPAFNDGQYTSPVGYFPANGYGLHDMAGNVWEWCWDWYAAYLPGNQTDPHGPATGQNGTFRIRRGGSWGNTAGNLRCARRVENAPTYVSGALGFRCVRGK